MAQPSTVRRFRIELSDVDRGVYDSLDLRVAQHPSENEEFLVTRMLAYALNLSDGMGFSSGLCVPGEPTVFARDPTGTVTLWIEIGQPSADRLSKGARACEEVQVWGYKGPEPWRTRTLKEGVKRVERVSLVILEKALTDALAGKLGRDNSWTIVRTDGALLVTVGEDTLESTIRPEPFQAEGS